MSISTRDRAVLIILTRAAYLYSRFGENKRAKRTAWWTVQMARVRIWDMHNRIHQPALRWDWRYSWFTEPELITMMKYAVRVADRSKNGS